MKCIIVDEMHDSLFPMLEEMNVQFDYFPKISKNEFLEISDSYDCLIIRSKFFVDKEVLDKCSNLKFIARAGAGLDNIDLDAAEKMNIHVISANEGNRDSVAEHTMGLLLSLLHNINKGNLEVNNGIWDREGNRGIELGGKTVAIIGYGNVGKQFAKRLSSFGCKVLAYDKYLLNYSDEYAQEASMEKIFDEADIVSFHVPLTDETLKLVDSDYIDKFKKRIFLLNTSRGKVVDLKFICEQMEGSKILGAALDVLENEKINDLSKEELKIVDYLRSHHRIIITPHVAGWTDESYRRINQVMVEKLKTTL